MDEEIRAPGGICTNAKRHRSGENVRLGGTGRRKKDSDVDILILSSNKQKTRGKVIEKAMDMLLDKGTYIS